MKQFNKSDLVNGMVVETRNNRRYLVLNDKIIDTWGYELLSDYNFKLKNSRNKNYDIIKIYKNIGNYIIGDIFDDKYLTLIWERPEPILDEVEKAYLSAVIKPFKDDVKYIKKFPYTDEEYISIFTERNECISFPYFKKDAMYKGMKVCQNYTLEELGL